DDNISVTLSVNFQFIDSIRKDVYRANYYLRKLGINPTPPGRSAVRDRAKAMAFSTAYTAQQAIKSALHKGR
ncbi:transcriptional regulator, partial [Paraburkholderia steynii]